METKKTANNQRLDDNSLSHFDPLMKGIFDNEFIRIACFDAELNYILVNHAYAIADKREPSFFQGKNYFDLSPREINQAIFQQVLESGQPYISHTVPNYPEQDITDASWSLVPAKNKIGDVIGLVLTLIKAPDRIKESEIQIGQAASEEDHNQDQALLRSVIKNAPIVLFAINEEGIFTVSEGRGLKELGLQAGQVVGKSAFNIYADNSAIIQDLRRALKGENFNSRTVVADLTYETYYTPQFNAEEKLTGTIGVAIDITENEKAADIIRQSEKRLSTILNNMQDTYYRTDKEGNLVLLSESVKEVFGYSSDEVTGMKMSSFYVDPDEREKFIAALQAAGGKIKNYEAQIKRKDGKTIWVSTNANFYFDANGEVLGVEGTTRDVTERRKERQELLRTKAEFEAIFNSNADAIVYADQDRNIVMINPAVTTIFGYSSDELLGQKTVMLYANPDDFLDQGKKRFSIEASREQPIYEIEYRRKDGSTFIGETLGTKVTDANGNVLGFIGSIRDVTTVRQEQNELNRLKSTLDRTLDSVFMFDPDSLFFFYVNQGGMNQVGYTSEEMYNKKVIDIKPDYDESSFRKLVEPLVSGLRDSLTLESRHRHKDGHDIPVEIFLQYIAPEGESPRFVAFVQDLTQRKSSEAQMQKLSTALEQSADAVVITDDQGIIEYINPAFEITTGYQKKELIGRRVNILKSGKQDAAFYKNLWETISSGKVFRNILINQKKDGSLYYEEKTITPLKDEKGKINHYISTGKDITERMESQQRLQYLAHHDVLTELPNRALFVDRLEHALSGMRDKDAKLAIIFLDLDRFKVINDTLGHTAGDITLQTIARRLQKCVRKGDTIARLGGDEFAVIIEGIKDINNITTVVQKILVDFAQPFFIDHQELFVTTSIGISFAPVDGDDAQTLLKNADIAMYRAKDLGRNTYQYYSSDMSARAFEKLSLETDLRYALERKQFELHYQPQVDISSGKIIGMEALLRWNHPDLGLVSPVDFIPLLEETGLMVPVGEWLIQSACQQAARWQNISTHSLRMSINISARQFNDPRLISTLSQSLEDTRLDPNLLEVEITESVIMQDDKWTRETFKALSDINVRFAIDDFGTGYSSLSYLKRFPIDTLKIDRSFIRDISNDPDDKIIVQTIIAMAESMYLQVIAEGVETEEQKEFLQQHGCNIVQGYLFYKPAPANQIEQILK